MRTLGSLERHSGEVCNEARIQGPVWMVGEFGRRQHPRLERVLRRELRAEEDDLLCDISLGSPSDTKPFVGISDRHERRHGRLARREYDQCRALFRERESSAEIPGHGTRERTSRGIQSTRRRTDRALRQFYGHGTHYNVLA